MFTTLDKQHLPWELLLDADPDKEKIQMYVDTGSGFVWQSCTIIERQNMRS